jgi:hypothetical protein
LGYPFGKLPRPRICLPLHFTGLLYFYLFLARNF